jgi:hypothetical protein
MYKTNAQKAARHAGTARKTLDSTRPSLTADPLTLPVNGMPCLPAPAARSATPAMPPVPATSQAHAFGQLGTGRSPSGLNLTERIAELLRLAREQGCLTFEDMHEACAHDDLKPEELDDLQ